MEDLKDNKKCISWFRNNKIIAPNMNCDDCKEEMSLEVSEDLDGEVWKCKNKKCQREKSIREDTFFEYSNISIPEVLQIIQFYCDKVKPNEASSKLKVDKQIVNDFYAFFDETNKGDIKFDDFIKNLSKF